MLPAGDKQVELVITSSTSFWSHVELSEIITKIIIVVASSWLFILLYQ